MEITRDIQEKYQFLNNAFSQVAKDNPKDKIEVIVGDDKQPDFKPQVKIQRWDNECNVSLRLVDDEPKTPTTVDNKIELIGEKKEVHFYDIQNEEYPEGATEFEVILKEKPLSNVVEFTLVDKDVEYFYQPALTKKEIDEGVVRPENVANSYAVYAKTPKTNYVGGKEYKVGKIGHIYRPKIIDAKGIEVWGDLRIENGVLSVTIPQDFLDNAIYPVIVDPTFGYTSVGASTITLWTDYMRGGNFSSPSDAGGASVSSLSMYIQKNTSYSAANVKGIIALWSNKNILTNGVGSGVVTSVTAGWKTSTFSTSPTVSASTAYLLAHIPDNPFDEYFDSAGWMNDDWYDTSNDYDSPTSPTDGGWGEGGIWSIYATYTAGGTVTSDERDAKITGKETASSNRSAKLTGRDVVSDDRNAKVTGKSTDISSRDAKVTGKLTANAERDASLVGKQIATSEISAKLTGKATATNDREAKVTGFDTANDNRSAKIIGKETAFPTGWSLLGKYTVDATKVAGTSDLTNQPVLLKDDDFIAAVYDGVDDGGGDLRFTSDEAGTTRLPCEVVSFNTATDTAQVWVKTTLDYDNDTVIYIWGDNTGQTQPARTDTYGADNVWSANYQGVWHLESNANDSSPNQYNMTEYNTPSYATGNVGNALDVERDSVEFVRVNDANCANLEISGSQTWMHLVKPESINTIQVISSKYTSADYKEVYAWNDNTLSFWMHGLTTNVSVRSTASIAAGNWYLITGIYDSANTKLKIFVNTTKAEVTASGSATDTNGNFELGALGDIEGYSWDGLIDESWIIDGARTDDWVTTMYNMLLDHDNFGAGASTATTYNRSVTESLGITDGLARTTGLIRALSHTVGLSDELSRQLTQLRGITDTLGITDDSLYSTIVLILLSDTMGITDDTQRVTAISTIVSDTLGITDTNERVIDFARVLDDTLGLTDVSSAYILINRQLADSLGVTDATSIMRQIGINISDTVGIDDALEFSSTIVRSVASAVGLTDEIATDFQITRTLADSLGLTDEIASVRAFNIELSEAIGISDELVQLFKEAGKSSIKLLIVDENIPNLELVKEMKPQSYDAKIESVKPLLYDIKEVN